MVAYTQTHSYDACICVVPLPFVRQGGALTTLILQNSALALVMRYTRVSGRQADMYISSTAVVMAEIFKVAVALVMQFNVSSTS